MALKGILIAALIILIIVVLIKGKGSGTKLSSKQSGTITKVISASDLETSESSSSNFTYSLWFYVDDWTYKYGQEKIILSRMDSDGSASPRISLGAFQNNLQVAVATYPDTTSTDVATSGGLTAQTFNCNVNNVPIQKWVNAIVSVNGRTLDVYLDGKLVKTCVMPGIVKIAKRAPIVITPAGGFSGYTANIEYSPDPINPQEAWNKYSSGYGGSGLSGFTDKYKLKVSFYSDDVEKSTLEI